MKPIEYERAYTWESTNYGSDEASLALLSAEIKFYDYVLNDKEFNDLRIKNGNQPLTNDEKAICIFCINYLYGYLNNIIPKYGVSDTVKNMSIKCITNIRNILNIEIINTLG